MERVFKPGFFYGWVVVVACVLLQLHFVWPADTIGVFLSDLQAEFGWSRTAISTITLFSGIGYVTSNLLGGWLTDKYGPRVPMVLCAVIASVAVYLTSRVSNLGQFYTLYVISGTTGFIMPIGRSIVQRWFTKRRRGLALGLVMAGSSTGGLMYPLLVNWVTTAHGWQSGYITIAIVLGSSVSIAAFLMVSHPDKMCLRPYGVESAAAAASGQTPGGRPAPDDEPVWTVKEALRTRAYILLLAYSLMTVIPYIMVSVHIIPFATEIGISKATATAALGTRNFLGIFGSIVIGSQAERLGWKRGLAILTALGAVWMVLLMMTRNAAMLWSFVILFGIFGMGRGPLVAGLMGTYYGTKSLTMLIALSGMTAIIGGASGPVMAGFIWDRTGSYFVAFLIGAILWIVAALAVVLMKQPRKQFGELPSTA